MPRRYQCNYGRDTDRSYCYKTHSEYELEIVNVFAARGKKLGAYNLMMAQNPVYVMTALKKGE